MCDLRRVQLQNMCWAVQLATACKAMSLDPAYVSLGYELGRRVLVIMLSVGTTVAFCGRRHFKYAETVKIDVVD